MKTTGQGQRFSRTLIALAVLAAIGQAQAQEAAGAQSSVTVGAGATSGDQQDRARFGLYNGMREDRGYGMFDFTYLNRDAAAGLWTTIDGRDLFLDSRELSFTTRKLGDWKITAGYSEILRSEPRTINTAMQGAGTTTPAIVRLATPGTGSDLNLDMQRKAVSLSGFKWLGGDLKFEASFKSEDKEGARIFGNGFACSATWVAAGACATSTNQWMALMLPEPIDSTIQQAEAKVTWSGANFVVTGGYYGSLYTNRNGNLTPTIPGSLNNPLGAATALDAGLRATLGLAMALPADSQAHQVYLAGNYRLTPTTVATFKYGYTHATQSEDFGGTGFFSAPPGRSNLGGEINTTLVQLGLTARPMPKLSLLANFRYEDKENKTPLAAYNKENALVFTNGNPSPRKVSGKAEASYLLPENIRGTLGVDWDNVDHDEFTPTDAVAGLSGLKQKTKELGYRAELRRSLSEDLTGSLSFMHSKREGDSPWLKPNADQGVTPANDDPSCVPPAAPAFNNCIYSRTGIFPFAFQDRTRDKVKAMASWMPSEELSLQFYVESGKDDFTAPSTKGLDDTRLRSYSVDASYRLAEDWTLTGYASRGDSTVHQAHSSGYVMALKNTTGNVGISLKGKASDRITLAAGLSYLNDKLVYDQTLDSLASAANVAFLAASGGVPDVTYKLVRLNVSGDYRIDKKSSVRLAVVHERSDFNEWNWQWNGVSYRFSDNTTIWARENQSVTFVGATYTHRW